MNSSIPLARMVAAGLVAGLWLCARPGADEDWPQLAGPNSQKVKGAGNVKCLDLRIAK